MCHRGFVLVPADSDSDAWAEIPVSEEQAGFRHGTVGQAVL